MPEPRLLTRAALRQVLGGMAWADVLRRIASGQIPDPMWGLKPDDKLALWDRRAVDIALDAASNLPGSVEAGTSALDRHFGFRAG